MTKFLRLGKSPLDNGVIMLRSIKRFTTEVGSYPIDEIKHIHSLQNSNFPNLDKCLELRTL